jgi:hypothetical protein
MSIETRRLSFLFTKKKPEKKACAVVVSPGSVVWARFDGNHTLARKFDLDIQEIE